MCQDDCCTGERFGDHRHGVSVERMINEQGDLVYGVVCAVDTILCDPDVRVV